MFTSHPRAPQAAHSSATRHTNPLSSRSAPPARSIGCASAPEGAFACLSPRRIADRTPAATCAEAPRWPRTCATPKWGARSATGPASQCRAAVGARKRTPNAARGGARTRVDREFVLDVAESKRPPEGGHLVRTRLEASSLRFGAFQRNQLGRSLRRFTSPTPSALRVSHPLNGLIPPEPCGLVSSHIRS